MSFDQNSGDSISISLPQSGSEFRGQYIHFPTAIWTPWTPYSTKLYDLRSFFVGNRPNLFSIEANRESRARGAAPGFCFFCPKGAMSRVKTLGKEFPRLLLFFSIVFRSLRAIRGQSDLSRPAPIDKLTENFPPGRHGLFVIMVRQ
ncbi:MAG: hypothetical protein HW380_10 [Magnetococcales bacterium]|nr:hypothetical protein [Magnetococcales bacterium]